MNSTSSSSPEAIDQSNKIWKINELYDLSTNDEWKKQNSLIDNGDSNRMIRLNMKSLKYFTLMTSNQGEEQGQLLTLFNLKTKLNRTFPILKISESATIDQYGRIILIGTNRKNLQVFDLESKSKILAIETLSDQNYNFATWHDSESFLFIEGSSLCRMKLSDKTSKEIIMMDIPVEFQTNIKSINYNYPFYTIDSIKNGEYSFVFFHIEKQVKQIVLPGTSVGFCLLEDCEHSFILATPTHLKLQSIRSKITTISYNFKERAYMSHYFKECQLVIFVGYSGDCEIFDLSSKIMIASCNFKSEILESFAVEESLVIVTKKGKVIQYNPDPSHMLGLYKSNYDVSPEIITYWKQKIENYISEFRISSLSSIRPLSFPLTKYNRDYYETHGGIFIFHPIISSYFPFMYQFVVRNELNIDFLEEEQVIIKDFISYLIYGGKDLKIDGENYLKWAFIFDRCWFEFTELESKIVKLFNSEFQGITSHFGPLLQKLVDYQSRNYNFENGLLQKCINFCKDVIAKKGVALVEPLQTEHVPIKLSLECLYPCQNSHDITLLAFGKQIGAHKTVLSTFSSMFEVMLDEEGSFKSEISSDQELALGEDENLSESDRDQKGELFKQLIGFCYTFSLTCSSEEAFPLFEMADQYQLDCLKTILIEKICNQLSMDTFIEILKWSELFSNRDLHDNILTFCHTNGKRLLETYSEQLTAHPAFLIRLLEKLYNIEK